MSGLIKSVVKGYLNGLAMAKEKKKKNKSKGKKSAKRELALVERDMGRLMPVQAPAAKSFRVVNKKPAMRAGSDGSVTVVHREMIYASVANSVTWVNQAALAINPGLSASFPWLSTIAANWKYYKFNSLCFEYVPLCATSTSGAVEIAPDYDNTDPLPATELAFSQYNNYAETSVWDKLTCVCSPIDMLGGLKRKYVRTAYLAPEQTQNNMYDSGQLLLYTTSGANTNAVGKLYVSYSITLSDPTAPPAPAIVQFSAHADGSVPVAGLFQAGFAQFPVTTDSFSAPVGGNVLYFYEAGIFIVYVECQGGGSSSSNIGNCSYANCSGSTLFNNANNVAASYVDSAGFEVVISAAQAATGLATVTFNITSATNLALFAVQAFQSGSLLST